MPTFEETITLKIDNLTALAIQNTNTLNKHEQRFDNLTQLAVRNIEILSDHDKKFKEHDKRFDEISAKLDKIINAVVEIRSDQALMNVRWESFDKRLVAVEAKLF